ncbi:MAG: hypothetical protein M3Z24_10840, partial [Chloroflexota bacterium]|nr:hypothetical protein [Chloroflexota bacterium]
MCSSTYKRAGELKTESVAASFTTRASNAVRSNAARASLVRDVSAHLIVGFLGLASQQTNVYEIAQRFLI